MAFGKVAIMLAADLAAGTITADAIKSQYGDSMLTEVLSIGGGLLAAGATTALLEVIDSQTGIISEVGEVIDDVFGGIFG